VDLLDRDPGMRDPRIGKTSARDPLGKAFAQIDMPGARDLPDRRHDLLVIDDPAAVLARIGGLRRRRELNRDAHPLQPLALGAAFTTIVNSLVNDIIMPPLGLLIGGLDFSNFFVTLKGGSYPSPEAAKAAGAVTINYGLFLNAVLRFVIVAFAIFILVKQVN